MNVGELVGGAVIVWIVGSQVRGMFRSASKKVSVASSASALVREALAERATTGQAPHLRDIVAAAREAQSASASKAFEAGQTESLVDVLETAREIARRARERPIETVELQTLANAARAAAAKVVADEVPANRHGQKTSAKQQQPRTRHDAPAPGACVREPCQALGAMQPLRKLHPMPAMAALAPTSPLTPSV